MEDIRALYYTKFLALIIDAYRDQIKSAKPGHCMKIEGLPLVELKKLIEMIRPLNKTLLLYILSDTETGEDYIHASKLIELRNNPEKPLMVLIPANSSTSAEDSYGDATFQNLSVSDLVGKFFRSLEGEIPEAIAFIWNEIKQLFWSNGIPVQVAINYLLYVNLKHYSDESWGNGLCVAGMIPDRIFVASGKLRRRFGINYEICSKILCDFSLTLADRVASLPLVPNTIQKELLNFLNNERTAKDGVELCRRILESYPGLNFENWKTIYDKEQTDVKVIADIVSGVDPQKELVKDEQGNYVLSISADRKGKISIRITSDPAPKDNLDIESFVISLISTDDFSELGVIKKCKVGKSRGATRKVSINIPNGAFEDGEYIIRVHAVNDSNIILDTDNPFKQDSVEDRWQEEKAANPDLNKEQFRQRYKVAYANESIVFTLSNNGESVDTSELGRRAKVDYYTQAIVQRRIENLKANKVVPVDSTDDNEGQAQSQWKEGPLNSIFQFDFGPAMAYQIQVSNKLIAIESIFLKYADKFGRVRAFVSANPTDAKLQSVSFESIGNNIESPAELTMARKSLFQTIKDSAADETGIIATTDVSRIINDIKEYVTMYQEWSLQIAESKLSESVSVTLQNLDTVILDVELPDGNKVQVKLISPLHPLRLAWMVNMYELFQDWEEKTLDQDVYRKDWSRKLENIFFGKIPMDVAPLILTEGALKEPYQYIGELTFGWGIYVQPSLKNDETFASEFRQLKSYISTVLNVSREKRIDSDVNSEIVYRHIQNYVKAHPYTNKLVINLFNAGDASVFANALVRLEREGQGKDYEIRIFADDSLIEPGEAFKDLLNPESNISEFAESFTQASSNRLFPKLRFSRNSLNEFIGNHNTYQAHMSFLINPFPVSTELVKPDPLAHSFFLNGMLVKSTVSDAKNGKNFVWNRYFAEKTIPNPVSEFANVQIGLFATIQNFTGHVMSTTLEESVPATTLTLHENDAMLLSFIHDISDWVVTFDKNMGPEFYDLPSLGKDEAPYLLDYVPGQETLGVSSYLTTRPTSEVEGLMVPHFKEFGIDIENKELFKTLLEDLRTVSSSLLMQVNSTQNKAFEVLGVTFTKRFLMKKHLLQEAFLIPIDLHKELFQHLDTDSNERADNLLININTEKREIVFTVIEIKCRKSLSDADADSLHSKIFQQIANTIEALKYHFEIDTSGDDRLDRELKTLELRNLMEFYIRRASRYKQLNPAIVQEFIRFLSTLSDGYTIRFKQLGVIYNFSQEERQKKEFYGDMTLYTMGKSVIDDILSPTASLDTVHLAELDGDFIRFFEPNRKSFEYQVGDRETIGDEAGEQKDLEAAKNVKDSPLPEPQSTKNPVDESIEANLASDKDNPRELEENHENETGYQGTQGGLTQDDIDKVEDNIDYVEPVCDTIIGRTEMSPQYGIIGKALATKRAIAMDLNECNTISLFGVQGAGKSYTIGTVTEMTMRQFSNVNKLPSPMASVIFHYSESMDYAPEFTSMVYPNDDEKQIAKLKAEYGADPKNIRDVVLLCPETQVAQRKSEYPDVQVYPIGFDSGELNVQDWMFLLGATGNDSTYVKELKQIMKKCRNEMTLQNIRNGVKASSFLSNSQKNLALQKLNFANDYITDGQLLQQHLKPGRLIIVDLRDEWIEKDEALGLFVVMLNIFASVKEVEGHKFNKFIVFDEAHKYMNNQDLVESITTTIREMRHKGVSIMIASQDPMSLPNKIIELSSIVLLHKFSSPAWVKHIQKSVTALQTLTATEMSSLGPGEAYLWAGKSSDKAITQRPVKISIRPRVTKHGGDTIKAVK